MPRAHKFITYLLIVLSVVVAGVLNWITGFLKSEHIPEPVRGYAEDYPFVVFFALLALAVFTKVALRMLTGEKKAEEKKTSEFTPRLRADLLELLRSRYAKRLSDSLEHEVRLQLGIQETPAALALNPNLRLVGSQDNRAVQRGTPIQRLFDEAGGRLLILGEAGAGKTTMLLYLAQVLVRRATENDTEPVPVVVNLASWARHGGTLREWLVEALQVDASVRSGLARTLAEGNALLLLLDGLDEVDASKRSACIAAINGFLQERAQRVVVCSRTREYERSGERLALEKAVRIEPLEPDQIIRSLKGISGTGGLQTMLREDDVLHELATTPLMMSVMLLAYGGQTARTIQAATPSERRRTLWDDYVTRMIARRPAEYAPEDTLTWLGWLAKNMRQDDMAVFIPDRMQPAWLTRPSSFKWAYGLAVGLVSGLAVGLTVGLASGLASGLAFGLAYGPLPRLLSNESESIRLVEQVNWSWNLQAIRWKPGLAFGLLIGLLLGLAYGLLIGLAFGLVAGLVAGLLWIAQESRSVSAVDQAQHMGERLHASRRHGLRFGLAAGGVGEALKYDVLCWLLAREGAIPWRYFRFLHVASSLLLLQQVGGAVRFRHLLLRDYFADLTPERIKHLAARVERRPQELLETTSDQSATA